MNQSFLFFELIGVFIVHWLILEPQTYVVVEQFGAENIPLLSGRLVSNNLPSIFQHSSPCFFAANDLRVSSTSLSFQNDSIGL